MDRIILDGQKIQYHTRELEGWLAGADVWPIYFEIGPSGGCNNRCFFCAYDYLQGKSGFIETQALLRAVADLAGGGAKSCMYAGEGEPLLHPDLVEMVRRTRSLGIEVAITSNFLILSRDLAEALLPELAWARCSLNATDEGSYLEVHRGPRGGFERVLGNLGQAVRVRDRLGINTTIGVQFIILPENIDGIAGLAGRLADLGVDYLALKPCIQHPRMGHRVTSMDRRRIDDTVAEVRALARNGFSCVFRAESFERAAAEDRGYEHCLALPFFAEIISDGSVYGCGPYLGDERFRYGNIHEQGFREIWAGPRRRSICDWAARELDVRRCMRSCRLDAVNRFLWSLKNPPDHVNFI